MPAPTRPSRRLGTALAVLVAALSACSGSDGEGGGPTPSTATDDSGVFDMADEEPRSRLEQLLPTNADVAIVGGDAPDSNDVQFLDLRTSFCSGSSEPSPRVTDEAHSLALTRDSGHLFEATAWLLASEDDVVTLVEHEADRCGWAHAPDGPAAVAVSVVDGGEDLGTLWLSQVGDVALSVWVEPGEGDAELGRELLAGMVERAEG